MPSPVFLFRPLQHDIRRRTTGLTGGPSSSSPHWCHLVKKLAERGVVAIEPLGDVMWWVDDQPRSLELGDEDVDVERAPVTPHDCCVLRGSSADDVDRCDYQRMIGHQRRVDSDG